MATKPKNKKKGGAKKRSNAQSTPNYDVSASLIKNEKLYEELMIESTKALMKDDDLEEVTMEYIVTARAKKMDSGSSSSNAVGASLFVGASDWVPVAQLCIVRNIHHQTNQNTNQSDEAALETTLTAALSFFCREINALGCLSAPSAFKSLPRNRVEYGIEPIESFMKFVYEDVIEGKNGSDGGSSSSGSNNSSGGMSKARAREILELEAGTTDTTMIKTAYKKQSFKYHPDRISPEDKETMADRFYDVKRAYETLNSGVRNSGGDQSWYESLGGRDRGDFLGPVTLLSRQKAEELCSGGSKGFKSAVVGIDPDLTMAFVARNQSAARL